LAKQADLQILFKPDSVGQLRAPGLSGRMTVEQALDTLLKDSGLEHVRNGDVVVVRNPNGSPGASRANEISPLGGSTLAMAEGGEPNHTNAIAQATTATEKDEEGSTSEEDVTRLGETLVTGTLIRGAQTASPLIIIGKAEIDQTGYSTVQEVIQSLPQNHGGGDSELATSLPGGSFLNMGMGSAANLRGLGSDSTLVLVNGRRVAPAAFGQFVDVSLIPLSAVERVEVLPDGASATYGSDAVGGVINLILSDEYAGAETLLKGGSTTNGDMEEYQLSQTLGTVGDRSQAVITYEYYKRDHLDANDRDFSEGAMDPHHLLPEQERHSVFAAADIEAGTRGHLAATALFSERKAKRVAFDTFAGEPNLEPSETRQLSASATGSVDFAASWQAEITALYGRNDSHRDVVTPTATRSAERNKLQLESLEFKGDGALFGAPGGQARLAVGGGWREERYEEQVADGFSRDRNVLSAFAELYWPILAQVELSLAARYEEYSDFGSTTNPKVGLVWSPAKTVSLRGTYGTSFRAPILSELDDSNANSLLFDFPDPAAADGTTLTMLASGNNHELQPEEATTWTAGLDIESGSLAGVEVHVTYFDTEFEDRITEPLPGFEVLAVYSQAEVYAPIITRPPDPAEVARLAALPAFFNLYGPFVPADVQAIVDRRRQNISATHVRGLDFAAACEVSTTRGDWTFRVDSTYYFEYSDQITSTAPQDDILDTAYHPLDLKARGGVSWSHRGWGASAFIHYTDGYVNDTVAPPENVGSWTTVDLQLTYETGPATGTQWRGLSDLRFALSAQNVLDEEPPFVTSPLALFEVGFDPTNASPVGRFLSLTATKRW
jgi:outer membrane cobalamin receptor